MEYLYYIELRNKADGLLTNIGPFLNLPTGETWTDSDIWNVCGGGAALCVSTGVFDFATGTTDYMLDPNVPIYGEAYIFLVHDGDAMPTPIPAAIWLLGSGLTRLAGLRWKFKS